MSATFPLKQVTLCSLPALWFYYWQSSYFIFICLPSVPLLIKMLSPWNILCCALLAPLCPGQLVIGTSWKCNKICWVNERLPQMEFTRGFPCAFSWTKTGDTFDCWLVSLLCIFMSCHFFKTLFPLRAFIAFIDASLCHFKRRNVPYGHVFH